MLGWCTDVDVSSDWILRLPGPGTQRDVADIQDLKLVRLSDRGGNEVSRQIHNIGKISQYLKKALLELADSRIY